MADSPGHAREGGAAAPVPHASHFGAFRARWSPGGGVEIIPEPDDPFPSSLLQSYAGLIEHPSRIGRPHIRADWLARRGDSRETRGQGPFVPVPWDEALDIVAAELAATRERHGNSAIFGGSYGWSSAGRFHHARSLLHRFLNTIGGFTAQVQNYSYAAAMTFLPYVLGSYQAVEGPVSSLDGIAANCRLMLCFGGISPGNMQVEAGGMGRHSGEGWLRECAARGMRIVCITPMDNPLPAGIEVEWVPIRPGTDAAVMLAMSQVLASRGLHDVDFLNRCCTGWERHIAYVTGAADGVVRDSAWAEAISGVPADVITELALAAHQQRSFITCSWSLQRGDNGEQPYWAAISLAAMLGHVGLPGGGFAFGLWSVNGLGNPRRPLRSPRIDAGENPVGNPIPVARIADMLLHPGESYAFDGGTRQYPFVDLVYWCGGNPFHHHQDLNRLQAAFRRPRTVIVQDIWWTATARHADIVLPATTTLERNDIAASARDARIIAMHRVLPPVGESRGDFEIFRALAERMGTAAAFDEGRDEMAWLRHIYEEARAKVPAEAGMPDFDSFWAQGSYTVPAPERPYTLFEDFRRDPARFPLGTESGRIELFCRRIAAMNHPGMPGHACWIAPAEWLGSRASPRQLHMISPQPATRLHGQLDLGVVSQAAKVAGHEAVTIHPDDAAARGIRDGDVVLLWNGRGRCLAGARLSERIMRGVVALPTGAWFRPAEASDGGSIDLAGNPNVLTLDKGTSPLTQAPSAQSALVEMERWTGNFPTAPDPGWPSPGAA